MQLIRKMVKLNLLGYMTPDGTKRYEHTEVGKNPVDLGEAVSRVLKEQCL